MKYSLDLQLDDLCDIVRSMLKQDLQFIDAENSTASDEDKQLSDAIKTVLKYYSIPEEK